jgi:hypothetical protein
MTTRHTPAPWVLKIRPAEHDDNVTVAEIEVNGKYRGGIARLQSAEHIDGIAKDELIANARLIAAAPEMLDALTRAVSCQPSDDSCEPWVSDARAAIAKAEGQP